MKKIKKLIVITLLAATIPVLFSTLVANKEFEIKNFLSRLNRLVIGENVSALLVNTKQGSFLVEPGDLGVGGELIKNGSYGSNEIEQILKLTNKKSSVLFVGAHVGALAIPVSKSVSKVTAIEANPNTFKLLSANISINNVKNITAIQIAASDKKGSLEFVLSKTNSGGSKIMPIIKEYMYFSDNPTIIKVEAEKLDDILKDDFDLILMDIEGSEYFALKGMKRILSHAQYLIVEFLPHHLKNVSGVSVKEFLELIEPHFNSLYIPSKKITVKKSDFLKTLEKMYDSGEGDDGIVFSKN